MCRITMSFGTLEDETFLIDIVASNNYFSYRNIFQNGVDALSKIDDTFFDKKGENLILFRLSDNDQFC